MVDNEFERYRPRGSKLETSHIVVDADERLGQLVVANGLPLSKIHHAAFDAQLIGIDTDFRIHVTASAIGSSRRPVS